MAKDWKCDNTVKVSFAGFWIAGWLFTVGFLKLAFWKAVLAIILWAYYLGGALSGLVH
jgi:hypothetical protein